ncbi:MAG: M23 family metallopeptidase [Acidobacteriota bacterium]
MATSDDRPVAAEPPARRRSERDLDSELVWWPWRQDDGGPRLGRPWRAVTLTASLAVLVWGYLTLEATFEASAGAPAVASTVDTVGELRARNLLVPVAGVERTALRGSFGDPRGSGRRHRGMDITAPRHRPVIAVEAGRIVSIKAGRRSGLAVRQLSADGRFAYFYAHLHEVADGLREGQEVRAGQVLGTVGSTGNAGTPHLHFGISRVEAGSPPGTFDDGIDPYLVFRP